MFEVFYDKDADEFDSEPLSVPSNIDMSFELAKTITIQGHPKLESTQLTNKLIESHKTKPKEAFDRKTN